MDKLLLFDQFAKGKTNALGKQNNCVIYTRVSSKEQEEGHSLETQKKMCEDFALKNNYNILGVFGGTYESAKTDERKEFNRMLQFVKKVRQVNQKISYIIISHIDRFSRTGANAIYIKEQLKTHDVYLQAVTTPVDPRTSIGDFQQNVQFIFSHYDNQMRRERTISGTKTVLLSGLWCGRAPFGYDTIRLNGERKIVINAQGKLLKKAFLWKASENITFPDICDRLEKLGLKTNPKRLSEYFRNPFYCGLMAHKALGGQIVEGRQEKLISRDVFLKVNERLANNKIGYKCNLDGEISPLKRFLKCDVCGNYLRGYIVEKKSLSYYKCNALACRNNISGKKVDGLFQRVLANLSITTLEGISNLFKAQMAADYNTATKEKSNDHEALKRQIVELEKKVDRLEERMVSEEIPFDIYQKHAEKFKAEKSKLERDLLKTDKGVSNLAKCIEMIIACLTKPASTWKLMPYKEKMLFQFMLFPEGISYNKQKDRCRTTKINSVIRYFAQLAGDWEAKKIGEPKFFFDFPDCVPKGVSKSNLINTYLAKIDNLKYLEIKP